MAEDEHAHPARESKSSDPDRAAILARRKHFIALALSGLATTACTDGSQTKADSGGSKGDSKGQVVPQPCLKESYRDEETEEQQPPQPCLSIEPPPQACLKVAAPEPEGETGSEDQGESETGAAEPAPKPCLKKAVTEPKPCLRKMRPEPCLMVLPSNDGPLE